MIAFSAPEGCSFKNQYMVSPQQRTGERKTHAKLNRHGKEFATGDLCNFRATLDAREVDEGGFDDAGLALECSDKLLRKAEAGVCHGEGGGASTFLGLDDFVTAELDAWLRHG